MVATITGNVLTADVMAAHRTLGTALLDPVLNAARVIKVVAWTVQLRYHVVRGKWSHAYYAFIFFANGTEEVLRKFDSGNSLDDSGSLRTSRPTVVHSSPVNEYEKA